ncbi:hypothetical protein C8Q77DRAFT_512023 [Trametes polyzona]|nr:hypothetical protein C8Q77DRAFT_512023 [Trametes polyzona]
MHYQPQRKPISNAERFTARTRGSQRGPAHLPPVPLRNSTLCYGSPRMLLYRETAYRHWPSCAGSARSVVCLLMSTSARAPKLEQTFMNEGAGLSSLMRTFVARDGRSGGHHNSTSSRAIGYYRYRRALF